MVSGWRLLGAEMCPWKFARVESKTLFGWLRGEEIKIKYVGSQLIYFERDLQVQCHEDDQGCTKVHWPRWSMDMSDIPK